MLAEYSRLNHAFELEDGYACQSEVTGVLKGLGFSGGRIHQSPSTPCPEARKPRVSLGKLLLTKPDILSAGRAHQPSGHGVHRLAGDLS
ncbi:MAG: hypothetical protein ACLTW9_22490 [Enterocloster sp.]